MNSNINNKERQLNFSIVLKISKDIFVAALNTTRVDNNNNCQSFLFKIKHYANLVLFKFNIFLTAEYSFNHDL